MIVTYQHGYWILLWPYIDFIFMLNYIIVHILFIWSYPCPFWWWFNLTYDIISSWYEYHHQFWPIGNVINMTWYVCLGVRQQQPQTTNHNSQYITRYNIITLYRRSSFFSFLGNFSCGDTHFVKWGGCDNRDLVQSCMLSLPMPMVYRWLSDGLCSVKWGECAAGVHSPPRLRFPIFDPLLS